MKPNPEENNNNNNDEKIVEDGDKEMSKEACAVCKVPAKQKCAACKATFYCSREHQKQHWKEHSRKCKCYKLVESPTLGRHYIASRRVEPGEVVIREEEALIFGPQRDTVPICLGCYAPLTSGRPCEECGWPLCDKCDRHDGAECGFTKRYKDTKVSITGFGIAHPTYKCISVVRALALRETDPEAYARFSRLSSSCGDDAAQQQEHRETARFVKRFFNRLTDVSEAEIERVAGILQINGHEVPTTEPASLAVYDIASYLEHSCRANCSKSFTDTGGIVVRAAVPIEKGEHITICYTDPLWGTANRRHHLSRTKFFDCACQRCSDPTEFNTMFDAVKCVDSNCTGNMLPPSFIQSADTPAYICGKCGASLAGSAVDELTEEVGRDLALMKKNDPDACRKFIKRQAAKLHDNHYYMTDVKLALAQLIGQQSGGLPAVSDDDISEKILLCKKLDDLLKVIVPAENRLRGLVLFEMHAAVAEFGRRQEKEQLYGILQESKRLLQESYQLLRHEPEILPEGKIARTAKRNLREMEVIIKRLCQTAVTPLL